MGSFRRIFFRKSHDIYSKNRDCNNTIKRYTKHVSCKNTIEKNVVNYILQCLHAAFFSLTSSKRYFFDCEMFENNPFVKRIFENKKLEFFLSISIYYVESVFT